MRGRNAPGETDAHADAMNRSLTNGAWTAPPVYPLLAAAYPLLELAAQNRLEVRLSDLVFPGSVTLWFLLLAWISSRLLSRDQDGRALVAFFAIVWFSAYGYAFSRGGGVDPASPSFTLHLVTIPLSFIAVGVLAWLATRNAPSLRRVSQFLNIATLALLGLSLLRVLATQTGGVSSTAWKPEVPMISIAHNGADRKVERPDIYFILLDAYSSTLSLRKYYDYDNAQFEAALRNRGFVIPAQSRANYVQTFLALPTILNWSYLDWVPGAVGRSTMSRAVPFEMIENNRTARFLQQQGYRFVFAASSYVGAARNRYADSVIVPEGWRGNAADNMAAETEFSFVWMRTTALFPLMIWACSALDCLEDGMSPYTESPEVTDAKLRHVADVAKIPQATFTFMHLMLPHEPFIFKADCSARPPYAPEHIRDETVTAVRAAYVEQVECLNTKLLDLVDRILLNSDRQPVILMQADHGFGSGRFGRPPPLSAVRKRGWSDLLDDRTSVFAAYLTPTSDESLFSDSISPVNVLPTVLNRYFDADIPLHDARTYYSTWDRPFDFTRLR